MFMVIHLKHRHKAYFIQSLSLFPSLMIYLFSSCAAAPEISGCLSNCLSETLGRLIHSSYRRAERKLPSAFNSLNWITVLHKHLSRLECSTRFNTKTLSYTSFKLEARKNYNVPVIVNEAV